MKACICIDYLSHDWATNDLIETFKGLNKQCSKTKFSLTTKDLTDRQRKKLNMERHKQLRYQNAVWRQMAKYCTNRLSCSNTKISPSSVNWQKESDITWLYGPLYLTIEPPEQSSDNSSTQKTTTTSKNATTPRYNPNDKQTLRSILKRRGNRPPATVAFNANNTPNMDSLPFKRIDHWNHRYWSKCASDSGRESTVRFKTEITEISYLPESPVDKSLQKLDYYINSDDESTSEDDTENDEEFWNLMILVGQYIKERVLKQHSLSKVKDYLLIQCCVAVVSFSTWFMYQTCYYLMFKSVKMVHQAAVSTLKRSNSESRRRLIKATDATVRQQRKYTARRQQKSNDNIHLIHS